MRRAVLLAVPLLLVLFASPLSQTAKATPIYFEEDFRGCGDGNAPSGWTHSPTGVGTIGCDEGEHFPDENELFLGEFLPGLNGTESLQQRLTSSLIDTWLSPTFSISGATFFSLGFAVRFEAFPGSTFGGAFQLTFRDGSTAAGGFGTRDNGIAHTLDVSSTWDSTGFQLVLDTWYVVQFDINRTTDRYAVFINGTQIDANGGEGGITQTMAPGAGAHDIDTVSVSSRLSGKSWIDWIFADEPTLVPIPDLTFSLCGTEGAEQTILDAGTDATSDVIFDLNGEPSFLGRAPATGRVFLINTAPQGPPVAGTFPVTVTANVSTGDVNESFVLTIEECDPFGWLRQFGPAWIVFLVFAATISFMVLMLWRGARGSPGRRRR